MMNFGQTSVLKVVENQMLSEKWLKMAQNDPQNENGPLEPNGPTQNPTLYGKQQLW